MTLKWPILWPLSLLSNSVYHKPLRFCLGVLLMAVVSVAPADVRLINISTRAPIQGGASDVIAGFIIEGTGSQTIFIKGIGMEDGVDPKLTLRTYPNNELVASNDNWQQGIYANSISAYPNHGLQNVTDAGL